MMVLESNVDGGEVIGIGEGYWHIMHAQLQLLDANTSKRDA